VFNCFSGFSSDFFDKDEAKCLITVKKSGIFIIRYMVNPLIDNRQLAVYLLKNGSPLPHSFVQQGGCRVKLIMEIIGSVRFSVKAEDTIGLAMESSDSKPIPFPAGPVKNGFSGAAASMSWSAASMELVFIVCSDPLCTPDGHGGCDC
jgi:hypothetical protein